ncbi:MAG: hypothetical protein PHI34_03555 [Acidobacteriota bacterium]|nr:hypothetical protein [Acidobacteriota bacterium]
MKARSTLGLILFLTLGVASLAAADKGFAGTWKLDPGESAVQEMYPETVPEITLAIEMDGAKLILRRKTVMPQGGERTTLQTLTRDGKESLNAGESFKDLKSVCRMESGKILISGEREGVMMTIAGGGEPETEYFRYAFEEEYSLSADGSVLTVIQKMQMPDGQKTMTLVFDRAPVEP